MGLGMPLGLRNQGKEVRAKAVAMNLCSGHLATFAWLLGGLALRSLREGYWRVLLTVARGARGVGYVRQKFSSHRNFFWLTVLSLGVRVECGTGT